LVKGDWKELDYLTLNASYGKEKRVNKIGFVGAQLIRKIITKHP
jgi:hypothetical protein